MDPSQRLIEFIKSTTGQPIEDRIYNVLEYTAKMSSAVALSKRVTSGWILEAKILGIEIPINKGISHGEGVIPKDKKEELARLSEYFSWGKTISVRKAVLAAILMIRLKSPADIRAVLVETGYRFTQSDPAGQVRTAVASSRTKGVIVQTDGVYEFATQNDRTFFGKAEGLL